MQNPHRCEWAGASPEEDIEAEHGEHDGEVAQHPHRVAQLVDQQEPLVDHPAEERKPPSSQPEAAGPAGVLGHLGVLQDSGLRVALKMT